MSGSTSDRVGPWRSAFVVPARARASLPLLATVLLMATLAGTLAAAIPTYRDAVVEASLKADVASAPALDTGVEVLLRHPASGAGELVPAVSAVVDDAFAAPRRSLVLARSDSFTLPDRFSSAETNRVTNLAFVDGPDDLLVDVEGSRATVPAGDAVAAALHTEAAELLGVGVGDRIRLGSRADGDLLVEVVALVEPADRTDPLWADNPLVRDGATESGSFTEMGPFLVDEATFTGLAGNASYRWRWMLEPDLVESGPAAATAGGVAAIPRVLADDLDRADADVTTGLPALVSSAETSIGAMGTVIGLVLVQVAGVALYGLALAALALVDSRMGETALLRSRGASALQLGFLATLEALLVVVPMIVVAPWLSRSVVDLLGRWGPAAGTGLDLRPEIPRGAWVAAAVVGLLTVAVVVTPAVRAAASFASARPQRPTEGGAERAGFLRRTGLDAAIAVVAVFGLWQMIRAGSVTATGRADPLLVGAPALGIIAISLLLLRMFSAAATLAERAASGRRGVVPALAGWELTRRPGRLGRIAVLVVLATAVGAFTAVHLSSLRQSQVEQGDARVSADLVVTPDARSRSQIDQTLLAGGYRTTPGVTGAMPLDRQTVSFGAAPTGIAGVPLISVDAQQVDELLRTPERLVGPAAEGWARLHHPDDLGGLPLAPEGAESWEVTMTAQPVAGANPEPSATAQVIFLVADRDATVHRLLGPELPLDGTPTRAEFDLRPEVDGSSLPFSAPLDLIGLELRGTPMALPPDADPGDLVGDQAPPTIEIGMTDLSVDGSPVGIESREWSLFDHVTSSTSIIEPDASAVSDEDSVTVEFNAGVDFFANSRPAVVSLATAPALGEQPPPIPVMLTDSLADTLGLRPGDTTAMTLRGRIHDVEVADTVAAVPFAIDAEQAVLADWSTLNTRQFLALGALATPTDWALGIEADAVDAARDTLLNDPFRSVAVSDRVGVSGDIGRDPTTVGLSGSMVLAFVAALTVAAVGMVLTAVMGARHRRGGVAILRALGIHRGELRRLLVLETLPLVAVSAVAGIITGIGLARLSLRSVAVSPDGTPAIPEPLLVVPWPAIAVVAGLVVVIGAVLPLLTARLLGRQRPADEIRFGEAR